MKFVQVLIDDIDISSANHDRYFFRYGRDAGFVKESVSKVGLINPVILREKVNTGHQKYFVVCGYQRIRACRELKWEYIAARIVQNLQDAEILLLALHDNLFSRGFNVIEKAIALKKFLSIGYTYDSLMAEIAPLFEIPQQRNIIDKYLSILRLDSEIKLSLSRSELDPESAFLLIALDDSERDAVYRVLLRESSMNINETKETVRNLLDLKVIKKTGIAALLSSGKIRHIISDNKINKKQKGEKIYRVIKSLRYPAISEKEEEFGSLCREMGMDNDVRINHSRYFEGDEIRIMLKVTREEKLRVNLEKLLLNIRNGMFKKIFSLFK